LITPKCKFEIDRKIKVLKEVIEKHRQEFKQVALLWQRDRATCLSVEILQLQIIPIGWHYLRDPTFSRFYTIPECDTHTQRDGLTDTRRRHVLRYSIASRGKNRPYCTRPTKYNYYAGNERRLI